MKSLLLATTVLALSVGTAVAQDKVYDWSGAYVGVQAGYGWGDSTINFDGINYIVPLDPDGFFGGVYVGYNRHLSNKLVIGVEGDAQLSNLSNSDVLGLDSGTVDNRYHYGARQHWNGSLRARVGYAAGRLLPYVTGGIAVARYKHFEDFDTPFSQSKTYTGWTVGAGIEYAATGNILIRAEYRYADFGKEHFIEPVWTDHTVNLKTNDLRFGVAYKF